MQTEEKKGPTPNPAAVFPGGRWQRVEPTDFILRLARSFPCLRIKLSAYRPAEFDADAFHALMDCWSSGERLCGLFVLNVWNPSYAKRKGWEFNLMDFMGTADAGNALALGAWIRNPIFP